MTSHGGTKTGYGDPGIKSYGGTRIGSSGRTHLWDESSLDWFAIVDAQLLGFDAARQEEYNRCLGQPLENNLPETELRTFDGWYRYFVILEAYDFHSLNAGPIVKPKLLWSVHYSLPAFGHNFTEGMPTMSKVAANFFGRDIGGVLYRAQKIPEGVVKMGDPRVIEEAQWK